VTADDGVGRAQKPPEPVNGDVQRIAGPVVIGIRPETLGGDRHRQSPSALGHQPLEHRKRPTGHPGREEKRTFIQGQFELPQGLDMDRRPARGTATLTAPRGGRRNPGRPRNGQRPAHGKGGRKQEELDGTGEGFPRRPKVTTGQADGLVQQPPGVGVRGIGPVPARSGMAGHDPATLAGQSGAHASHADRCQPTLGSAAAPLEPADTRRWHPGRTRGAVDTLATTHADGKHARAPGSGLRTAGTTAGNRDRRVGWVSLD